MLRTPKGKSELFNFPPNVEPYRRRCRSVVGSSLLCRCRSVAATCSAIGSGDEEERDARYGNPPECREKSVWTNREIITFISPGRLATIPSNSESLIHNAASRKSSTSYRESESRMRCIGPVRSRGKPTVLPEPNSYALGDGSA